MGMFDNWWEGVKHRVTNPTETLAKAIREQMPTKENPMGGVGIPGVTIIKHPSFGKILENPTREMAENLAKKSEFGSLRIIVDPDTLKTYAWDASKALHNDVAEFLGISPKVLSGDYRLNLSADQIKKHPLPIFAEDSANSFEGAKWLQKKLEYKDPFEDTTR